MMRRLLLMLCLLVIPTSAWSQGFDANVSNIRDPRVYLLSPAAMGLRETVHAVAGYNRFHAGVAADRLSSGLLSFALPVRPLGSIGLNVQYFSSDVYRQGQYRLAFGRSLLRDRLQLGFDVGMLTTSYRKSNFSSSALNDPLFANGTSKSSLDTGVGAIANPFGPVYIGLAATHLNAPNIALDDSYSLPSRVNAGAMAELSFGSPMLGLSVSDGLSSWDLGLERWFLDQSVMLRGFYGFGDEDQEDFRFGAAYVLDKPTHAIRFDYEYLYPLSNLNDISNGTHQFLVSYAPHYWDFELRAHPRNRVVNLGQDAHYTISCDQSGEPYQDIQLRLPSPGTCICASLDPLVIDEKSVAELVLTPVTACRPGTYQYEVYGTADGKERSCLVTLEVQAPRLSGEVTAAPDTFEVTKYVEIKSQNPLIPYIFFEKDKYGLDPIRYEFLNAPLDPREDRVFFDESSSEIPDQYRNTLNVIAQRLMKNPDMQITITGCNSDWGSEAGNLTLSRQRAEAVRDYLIEICGVAPAQILAEARNLPPAPASQQDIRGREENQRVEITTDTWSEQILEPIVTETVDIVTTDKECEFQAHDVVAEAGLTEWEIMIVDQESNLFRVLQGVGLPAEPLRWDWRNFDGETVGVGSEYRYQLILRDEAGQTFESDWKSLYVKQSEVVTGPITQNIERTRLILFQFNNADLDLNSGQLREELDRIVQRLNSLPNSMVHIDGHADTIGLPEYNRTLSERRADGVVAYLERHGIPESRITCQGHGTDVPLMDNDLPEGRMVNRRAEITVIHDPGPENRREIKQDDDDQAESTPTPTPTPVAGVYQKPVGQDGWALHLYSLSSQPSAEEAVRDLQKLDIQAVWRKQDVAGKGTWYRVYVGSFPDQEQASLAVSDILARLHIDWAGPVRFSP
ncbi:MAG: OmpA family protein [bacterium]